MYEMFGYDLNNTDVDSLALLVKDPYALGFNLNADIEKKCLLLLMSIPILQQLKSIKSKNQPFAWLQFNSMLVESNTSSMAIKASLPNVCGYRLQRIRGGCRVDYWPKPTHQPSPS